jgi:hypothetical protein
MGLWDRSGLQSPFALTLAVGRLRHLQLGQHRLDNLP